ncbi:MAG: hypothetical protein HY238_13660 [Acidobacteria bacterium]|nr:hypothetical protein [Acidobacteriota bacterium]
MEMEAFRADILKQEIEYLHHRLDHFDDLRHRTKQMAATLCAAAIGAGLTITTARPLLFLLAAAVALPFWYRDAVYHAYQEGFHARLRAVRNFIRDGSYASPNGQVATLEGTLGGTEQGIFPLPDYYGTKTLHEQEHKRLTNRWRNATTWNMTLFYAPLCVAPLLLFLFLRP